MDHSDKVDQTNQEPDQESENPNHPPSVITTQQSSKQESQIQQTKPSSLIPAAINADSDQPSSVMQPPSELKTADNRLNYNKQMPSPTGRRGSLSSKDSTSSQKPKDQNEQKQTMNLIQPAKEKRPRDDYSRHENKDNYRSKDDNSRSYDKNRDWDRRDERYERDRDRNSRDDRERHRDSDRRDRDHRDRRQNSPPDRRTDYGGRKRSRSPESNRSYERSDSRSYRRHHRDSEESYESYREKKRSSARPESTRNNRDNSADSSSEVPFVQSSNKAQRHDTKVREIWIGNLPESITEDQIYSNFFICGEIEEIEIMRHNKINLPYAFVRFKLTSCSKRAYDLASTLEITNNKLKVQYSDFNKRSQNILGDLENYDLTNQNCKTLFIAFSVNTQLPDRKKINEIFSKYGKIRAIWMRQTEPNTKYRPHFFVDYRYHEEAKKAISDLFEEDKYGVKRTELGDKSCEILLAIKKRNKDFSNPNLYQHLSLAQQQTQFQQHAQVQHAHSFSMATSNPYTMAQMQMQRTTSQPVPNLLQAQLMHGQQFQVAKQIHQPALNTTNQQQQFMFQPGSKPLAQQQAPQFPGQVQAIQQQNAFNQQLQMQNKPPQTPGAKMLPALLQLPPFQNLMRSNPTLAKKLITQIQNEVNPANINKIIESIILQESAGLASNSTTPKVVNPPVPPPPAQIPSMGQQQQPIQQKPPPFSPALGIRQPPNQSVDFANRGPVQMGNQQQQFQPPQKPPVSFQQPQPPKPQEQPSPTLSQGQKSTSIVDFIKNMKKTDEKDIVPPALQGYRESDAEREKRERCDSGIKPAIEDDEMHIWSGFVTRNKQHRVCVDAYTVTGSNNGHFLMDQDHNLNISHRTNYEDAISHKVQGIVAFVPQNETQIGMFSDYISYFQQKERAGLAFLRNGVMFLLPPCQVSRRFFQSDKPHMVGIFGDSQASQAQQARFSNGQTQNNTNMIK